MKPKLLHTPLVLLLTCALHAGAHGASFDCSKAVRPVEKLICADEGLSELDGHVSALFSRAVYASSAPEELRVSQRRWLRQERDGCTSKTCLELSYRSRRLQLERIAGKLNGLTDATFNRKLCEVIANPGSRRALLSNTLQPLDINNDGRRERWDACDGGTMHAPCTRYTDEQGHELRIRQVGFEWNDYGTFGEVSFRHAGRTWTLHGYDDRVLAPAYLTYVTPDNEEHLLCEFANELVPFVKQASPAAEGLCRSVLEGNDNVRPLAMPLQTIHPPHTLVRDKTTIGNTQWIDVDNDGQSERVVELFYSGTAGRGCEVNYFDILEEDGLQLSLKALRARFLKMQMIDLDGEPSGNCSTANRLLLIDGVTYHESNVSNSLRHPRLLRRMTNDEPETVCHYGIDVKTRVKSVR